ncbi:SDR family oxidoreductase [Longimicrobium sp.]|uniref:SDR family oxidoreductase n=1 Tax=Longimicrobium sp. TaxID=2029185 RepID=UPI003B3B676B
MRTVYLTGGTGFLGSHFIRNHLLGGSFDVQCFVRGPSPEACALRLDETLREVDASYPDRRVRGLDALTAIPSDITLPAFGLEEAFFAARAGRADATFFHFASSLQYQEKDRQVIHDHNIGGLRHAVDVAAALGCGVFYYVSTAFTVGVHEGPVPEALHHDARFNNYYEETKCQAEHLITELCRERGISLVIVRPSIVIGPSATRRPGGSRTGLYGFIRELHRLKRQLRHTDAPLSLYGSTESEMNVVPVDFVCYDIFSLYRDSVSEGVYHCTAGQNVRVQGLTELILKHLELTGVTFRSFREFDEATASALERVLLRNTAFYASSTAGTKLFQRRRGPGWPMDLDEVERYVIEGVRGLNGADAAARQPPGLRKQRPVARRTA